MLQSKIALLEKSIKLFEKAYEALFKIVATRFGSGVLGFMIAFGLTYFAWIERLKQDLEAIKSEHNDLRKEHSALQSSYADVYQNARLAAKAEAEQEYKDKMQMTFQYFQEAQKILKTEVSNREYELHELESEIKRRNQ